MPLHFLRGSFHEHFAGNSFKLWSFRVDKSKAFLEAVLTESGSHFGKDLVKES